MKLVQKDIIFNYKTYELLVSMIDLSRVNMDRFRDANIIEKCSKMVSNMAGFDTGRQTGKSTAIARYLRENDNVVVVSPSTILKKIMNDKLHTPNKFNLSVHDFNRHSAIFKGLYGEFDLIFDECSLKDIQYCLKFLVTHTHIEIKSIVKVGL